MKCVWQRNLSLFALMFSYGPHYSYHFCHWVVSCRNIPMQLSLVSSCVEVCKTELRVSKTNTCCEIPGSDIVMWMVAFWEVVPCRDTKIQRQLFLPTLWDTESNSSISDKSYTLKFNACFPSFGPPLALTPADWKEVTGQVSLIQLLIWHSEQQVSLSWLNSVFQLEALLIIL